jgi:ZIP family zinc transporter
MAEEIQRKEDEGEEWKGNDCCDKEKEGNACEDSDCVDNNCVEGACPEEEEEKIKPADHTKDSDKLMRMSINTAIAIGLHNFPEGLATFVATLNDPKVGMVLAVAIAIHNIPEGLCVAMPIYYATGNRWKAFGWALLSGISEPFAAFLGWIVLANSFNDEIYGALFGLVAGMMIIISVRELLPTAHRYDPEDTVVTYSFMSGMGVMALSLVLFKL